MCRKVRSYLLLITYYNPLNFILEQHSTTECVNVLKMSVSHIFLLTSEFWYSCFDHIRSMHYLWFNTEEVARFGTPLPLSLAWTLALVSLGLTVYVDIFHQASSEAVLNVELTVCSQLPGLSWKITGQLHCHYPQSWKWDFLLIVWEVMNAYQNTELFLGDYCTICL